MVGKGRKFTFGFLPISATAKDFQLFYHPKLKFQAFIYFYRIVNYKLDDGKFRRCNSKGKWMGNLSKDHISHSQGY
jgi:hypothetical protein